MIGPCIRCARQVVRALFAVVALLVSEGLQAQSADNSELVAKGRQIYALSCSRCHGPNMVSVGTVAFDLRRFPLDQKDRFVNSVKNGLRVMPAWGEILSPEQIEALWVYVSSAPRP